MSMKAMLTLFLLMLASCAGLPDSGAYAGKAKSLAASASEATETLTVLSFIGGICLVAGMALLVMTSGKKGWFPIVGGLGMVLLNYVVAAYSDFLFIPLIACTGVISAAWAYKTVRQILMEKKAK